MSLRNQFPIVLFVGLIVGATLLFAEPVRGASPFYDLRNEADRDAETADLTSPDTTPETADSEAPSGAAHEADSGTATEDPGTEPSDAGEPESTPDTETARPESEPDRAEEPEETPADTSVEPSESQPRSEETSAPERTRADGTILPLIDTEPVVFGTMPVRTADFPDTMDTAVRATPGTTVSTTVANAPMTGTNRWEWYGVPGEYYLLIGSGTLGLLGLFLLGYLLRQPRVRVIKTANRTANKYLNLSRTKRRMGSEKQSLGEPVEPSGRVPGQGTGPADGESPPVEQETGDDTKASPEWDLPEDTLLDMGIDPAYRTAFKLYYEEGLNVEEVAERTDHGSGEIGLAVDLLERSRDRST